MIINYGIDNLPKGREAIAEKLFKQLPFRHCLVTGSFVYKNSYKDIDVFVISRSEQEIPFKEKFHVEKLSFNSLHSLFFHSISKQCIAKNILPIKQLRVTMADYWETINEGYTTVMNERRTFKKPARDIVLYTNYLRTGSVLGSVELAKEIEKFKSYKDVLAYIQKNVPETIRKMSTKSYRKRYFYSQSGVYKETLDYKGTEFLYNLSRMIAHS